MFLECGRFYLKPLKPIEIEVSVYMHIYIYVCTYAPPPTLSTATTSISHPIQYSRPNRTDAHYYGSYSTPARNYNKEASSPQAAVILSEGTSEALLTSLNYASQFKASIILITMMTIVYITTMTVTITITITVMTVVTIRPLSRYLGF